MTAWPSRAPSGRIAYVDGRYLPHGAAGVHIEDRGLQFGDSIYEVWRLAGGRLLDLEEHLDRLERSLGQIEIALPMTRPAFKLVLAEIVRRNAVADAIVYLQVTRGAGRREHPVPSPAVKPSVILTVRRLDTESLHRRLSEGVTVVTAPDQRWARCDIKSIQLLPNLLAKTAARRAGAYEVWLTDAEGFITEGASTTAWIVDGEGRLITRPLSDAVLPGVTRRVLLELAKITQIPVVERKFTPQEAKGASEAFLTAASAAAVPVVMIDGAVVGTGKPGPITLRLQTLYTAHR
jgi:D-alanine transaminase